MSKDSAPNQTDAPGTSEGPTHSNRERWLQLALVAVCAALEEVECTDQALTEALFVGMPGMKIDEVTAAAVAYGGAHSLRVYRKRADGGPEACR